MYVPLPLIPRALVHLCDSVAAALCHLVAGLPPAPIELRCVGLVRSPRLRADSLVHVCEWVAIDRAVFASTIWILLSHNLDLCA